MKILSILTIHPSDAGQGGEGIIVVDAGGGTIDLSAFHLNKDTNQFEEIPIDS
jgi:molecular chaperone DnaK (HSP70)